MSVVLDASALLAYLQDEPGGERVRKVITHSIMSTVNWAEVIGKARDDGVDTRGLRGKISHPSDSRSSRSRPIRPTLPADSRNAPSDSDSRSATGRASRSGAIGAKPSTWRTAPGRNWISAWRWWRSGSRRNCATTMGQEARMRVRWRFG